jgi:hypothetical protein
MCVLLPVYFSFFAWLRCPTHRLSYHKLALDNVLVRLSLPPTPVITMMCAYAFSLGVIAPGIPVCSITTRCKKL